MKELLNILRQEVELHEQLIAMLQKESEGFAGYAVQNCSNFRVKSHAAYVLLSGLRMSEFSLWIS